MEKVQSVLKNLAVSLFFIVVPTVLGHFFIQWDFHSTNVVILYLLSVLLTSRFTKGYVYGLGATVLSFLLFNWFFTEPYYSLKINDFTNIITVIVMTVTATITSALTCKVKQAAAEAQEKEAESNALYQMTNYLTDAENCEKIASVTMETVSRILSCYPAFVCCDENGSIKSTFIQQKENGQQIHRELENPAELQKRMENLRTSCEVWNEFCMFPIYGRTMMLAVLGIPKEVGLTMSKAQIRVLHSIMESSSLALDRIRSLQEKTKSQEEAMQERYRGNLLRAISHDLRTPLSGIMGTSEMLMGMTENEDPRYNMARDIYEDANWLHGLVENILNLTRFQEGRLTLKKEPEAVEEVVGAALMVMEKRVGSREISVQIPDNVLMVPMDARLIAQVLVNLLDNAVKHTPPEAEISVSVKEDTEHLTAQFTVSDRGSGIPEKSLDQIFKMFYTVAPREASNKKGVGLGLSICQSIVEAHGGRIWAQNRTGGGAEFIFTLPLEVTDHGQP